MVYNVKVNLKGSGKGNCSEFFYWTFLCADNVTKNILLLLKTNSIILKCHKQMDYLLLQDSIMHFRVYFQILKHPLISISNTFLSACSGRLALFSANSVSTMHFLYFAEYILKKIMIL